MSTNKPVHEIRLGHIKAAIWMNLVAGRTNGDAIRHNVTLCRIYHDGKQWKSSDSFGRDDLPLVIKVANLAHDWIYQSSHVSATAERADAF